ncbi:MAG: flagellar filament capping protein FliD [Gammaproteobacteria bacterium]
MNLSSPGVGSGLDVRGIIEQLMSVERQPLVRLDADKVELKAQLSAYGSLKAAVATFRDAVAKLDDLAKFKVYAASSSDKDVLEASASSAAARGIYNIQINRIAENHRMAAATTLADTGTTIVGAVGDTMTLNVGGGAFTVEIGGKTLSQIRDAINEAGDNAGVTASILKDNVGYRLSIASNDTGAAKALTVSYSGADPFALATLNADRDSSGTFTPADLDASVRLEGLYDITSASNTLSDTIEGVTLTLKQAGTVTVNVSRDTGAVEKSVQEIVKAYSDLVGTMGKMRGQVLKSDSPVLLNIESQLRSILNSRSLADSGFENVFQLGLSTQKNGTLQLDTKVLSSALANDFEGVASLFADPTYGIAVQLETLADSFLETGGALDGRTQGLNDEVRANEDRKLQLEERVRLIEIRYTQQFNSLDRVIAQLTQTGNLVTQQLALLNRSNFNNNR